MKLTSIIESQINELDYHNPDDRDEMRHMGNQDMAHYALQDDMWERFNNQYTSLEDVLTAMGMDDDDWDRITTDVQIDRLFILDDDKKAFVAALRMDASAAIKKFAVSFDEFVDSIDGENMKYDLENDM